MEATTPVQKSLPRKISIAKSEVGEKLGKTFWAVLMNRRELLKPL
jgi:hypothetical protein